MYNQIPRSVTQSNKLMYMSVIQHDNVAWRDFSLLAKGLSGSMTNFTVADNLLVIKSKLSVQECKVCEWGERVVFWLCIASSMKMMQLYARQCCTGRRSTSTRCWMDRRFSADFHRINHYAIIAVVSFAYSVVGGDHFASAAHRTNVPAEYATVLHLQVLGIRGMNELWKNCKLSFLARCLLIEAWIFANNCAL